MKIRKSNSTFIISVIGHLLVLSFILIELNFTKQEVKFGKLQSVFPAYIYQENLTSQIQRDNASTIKHSYEANQLSKNGIALYKKNQSSPKKNTTNFTKQKEITPSINPQKVGSGKPIPELIALLHSIIQEHQQYPNNALQMEREGKTILMFILYPNGTIKNLRMLSSSGTPTLDEAAIAAVNDAIPFKGVDKYLTNPQEYQITVAFELT